MINEKFHLAVCQLTNFLTFLLEKLVISNNNKYRYGMFTIVLIIALLSQSRDILYHITTLNWSILFITTAHL